MVLSSDNRILDKQQIEQKIRRIAYEIYEQNFEETEIVIAGIREAGYHFGKLLAVALREIADFEQIHFVEVQLDKTALAQSAVRLDQPLSLIEGKVVVLTDDVLNTGKTTAFSLQPFLQIPLKKLQVAVLVNRDYSAYPIAAQYIGYSLSTTFNQYITVKLEGAEAGVYLHE